jgi:hypothetical protein
MIFAVSTLFALLVVGVSSTPAPNRLNRVHTVPIHTDANWKEGTVTILGEDPVDLSTLDPKITPFDTEGVKGEFKKVAELHVDIVGSGSPFEFEIRREQTERPAEYQYVSLSFDRMLIKPVQVLDQGGRGSTCNSR